MKRWVGKHEFGSTSAVKTYLSKELNKRKPGDVVTDTKLHEVLSALAKEHPRADEKIGPGIEYWIVRGNAELHNRSNGFWIKQAEREDLVDFGYSKVLSPPGATADLATALTEEARDITEAFRTSAFSGGGQVICIRTGEPIIDKKQAQAIHLDPSRAVLHHRFLDQEGLNVDEVELVALPGISGKRLADRALADRWREFQRARLDGMAIAKL